MLRCFLAVAVLCVVSSMSRAQCVGGVCYPATSIFSQVAAPSIFDSVAYSAPVIQGSSVPWTTTQYGTYPDATQIGSLPPQVFVSAPAVRPVRYTGLRIVRPVAVVASRPVVWVQQVQPVRRIVRGVWHWRPGTIWRAWRERRTVIRNWRQSRRGVSCGNCG